MPLDLVSHAGNPGGWIRRSRRDAGLTQQQLAERAGISVGAVRDLEQGRVMRPHSHTAQRIAEALNVGFAAGSASRVHRTTDRRMIKARGNPELIGTSERFTCGVQIRILGPVMACRNGKELVLGRPGQRAVLGLLALNVNCYVHRDTIIDAVWGGNPPETAVALIQTHISRLRSLLDGNSGRRTRRSKRLTREGASYRLCATEEECDLLIFIHLVERAREAAKAGEISFACESYSTALSLWHGRPLDDIEVMRNHPAVINLTQLRTEVTFEYADAVSLIGRHDLVLPYLRMLASSDLLNESAHARLMIALARSGRRAEALRLYDAIRKRLNDQLGVGPSAELTKAYACIRRKQRDHRGFQTSYGSNNPVTASRPRLVGRGGGPKMVSHAGSIVGV